MPQSSDCLIRRRCSDLGSEDEDGVGQHQQRPRTRSRSASSTDQRQVVSAVDVYGWYNCRIVIFWQERRGQLPARFADATQRFGLQIEGIFRGGISGQGVGVMEEQQVEIVLVKYHLLAFQDTWIFRCLREIFHPLPVLICCLPNGKITLQTVPKSLKGRQNQKVLIFTRIFAWILPEFLLKICPNFC